MDERTLFENRARENKRYVLGALSKYIFDEPTRQDLTQEIFLKAWIFRDTFKGESKYSTWLYKIAINTIINHLVASNRKIKILDKEIHAIEDMHSSEHYMYLSPEGILCPQEHLRQVLMILSSQSKESRDTFVLSAMYGMSHQQIASYMKIPVNTVKTRIKRVRDALKEKYKLSEC